MNREIVYYEDFAPDKAWEWGSYIITREEIIRFASKYDPQPFHLEEKAAFESVFHGFTASSVHTIAIANKMLHLENGPRFMALAQLAITDIAFPNPVREGDSLRIKLTCLSKHESQSKSDRGVVVEQCTLLNQHDDECFRGTHTILVPKRAA